MILGHKEVDWAYVVLYCLLMLSQRLGMQLEYEKVVKKALDDVESSEEKK